MNVNDLEVVLGILKSAGFNVARADRPEEARVILVNTCAIRENAEAKVWHRLNYFKHVAVLGCMAERLKEQLVAADKMVDVVCGPDAYRDLPRLLDEVDAGQPGVNTLLSLDETYADVSPVRLASNSVSAFVTIMRGCDNMCSYCIVPFTRGRERSRPIRSILGEIEELAGQGVKEIYLLGQNVNSYRDTSEINTVDSVTATVSPSSPASSSLSQPHLTPGFSTIYKSKLGGIRFATLLDEASRNFPDIRFRFTSPHPKDFPEELLSLMAARGNVCKSLHLPAQSGSSSVLGRMRRGYSREAYLQLVDRVRSILPDVAISSDFITEEEHQETLSLMRAVQYDMAYMFAYSLRPRTHAHRRLEDDVPEEVKQQRLSELVSTFRETTVARYEAQVRRWQCPYRIHNAYALRPRTHAHRRLEDDVPEEVKQRRLSEVVSTFRETTAARYEAQAFADLIGTPRPAATFLLASFAFVPIAWIHRFISSPTLRHVYCTVTGLLLSAFVFGYMAYAHFFVCILYSMAVMRLMCISHVDFSSFDAIRLLSGLHSDAATVQHLHFSRSKLPFPTFIPSFDAISINRLPPHRHADPRDPHGGRAQLHRLFETHIVMRTHETRTEGVLDCTGALTVLATKLTAVAYNYQDGLTLLKEKDSGAKAKDEKEMKELSEEQRRREERMERSRLERRKAALVTMPSVLVLMGYLFCFGLHMTGPFFEFKAYDDWTRRQGVASSRPSSHRSSAHSFRASSQQLPPSSLCFPFPSPHYHLQIWSPGLKQPSTIPPFFRASIHHRLPLLSAPIHPLPRHLQIWSPGLKQPSTIPPFLRAFVQGILAAIASLFSLFPSHRSSAHSPIASPFVRSHPTPSIPPLQIWSPGLKQPSIIPPFFRAFIQGILAAVVFLLVSPSLDLTRISDRRKNLSYPFHLRWLFAHQASIVWRFRAYILWSITEAAMVVGGEGKALWNRARNADILGFEFPKSCLDFATTWNISYGLWLRLCES
ncbi:unnamed protein product [Closterium sp. Yama58-4]|nr:unnamed protein product [Closterium sp. Yama58-4]